MNNFVESLNIKEKLFYKMYRIRKVEEQISKVYPDQEIRCPVHLSIGQEACAVGVCEALKPKDEVYSGHRNHAHYLAKGGDLKLMISELYGKNTGCCRGKGGSMHLTDLKAGFIASTPIVGSTIPISVGNSLANKLKGNNKLTCIFFGDGATETGVFYESLNIAASFKLPIIFVCENNFYSVYSPLKVRQPEGRIISETASALKINTTIFDGKYIEEIFKSMKSICKKVRDELKPHFVLFNTYRFKEHCGPGEDDHLNYRTKGEVDFWKKKDPILEIQNKISDVMVSKIKNEINKEISEAFIYAKESAFPDKKEASKNVFSE